MNLTSLNTLILHGSSFEESFDSLFLTTLTNLHTLKIPIEMDHLSSFPNLTSLNIQNIESSSIFRDLEKLKILRFQWNSREHEPILKDITFLKNLTSLRMPMPRFCNQKI